MSIQDGLVKTEIVWLPGVGEDAVSLTYEILAHREWPNLGVVRLNVNGLREGMSVAVTDVFDVRLSFSFHFA